MIKLFGQKIQPTIFPDGTSQVWKLPESLIVKIQDERTEAKIEWIFENEAELIHVLQLRDLISGYNIHILTTLYIPYLPYARQDKSITNESTFALYTFIRLIEVFDYVETFDAHNPNLMNLTFGADYNNVQPEKEIKHAVEDSGSNFICYPDSGASSRYPFLDGYLPHVVMDKVRDQLTGEIKGLKIVEHEQDVKGKNVLIVDDLCDGGRTFREASKVLHAAGANRVCLYVSHGLFTHPEGVNILHQDYINRVYTREGLYSTTSK